MKAIRKQVRTLRASRKEVTGASSLAEVGAFLGRGRFLSIRPLRLFLMRVSFEALAGENQRPSR